MSVDRLRNAGLPKVLAVLWLGIASSACGARSSRVATPTVQAVFDAARDENPDRLVAALDHGIDPNVRDADGDTPLVISILSTRTHVWTDPPDRAKAAVIESLLAHGADPNVRFRGENAPDVTPLMWAAHVGNLLVARELVAAGANVRARDARGRTALHYAAMCDFRLSCDDCGSDEASFDDRWRAGARPVIALLLAHGADAEARDEHDRRAIDVVPEDCVHTRELLRGAYIRGAAQSSRSPRSEARNSH